MLLGCMKAISGFGAFVILIVGLGMTGITIYGFAHSSEIFLNDTSARNSILGVLIAADLIIVLGSILGIYGIRKSNALLICVFQILVILFLIVFFSLGIAAEVLPSKFFDGKCEASGNPTLALAYSVTDKADQGFCNTCTCNLKDSTINSGAYNDDQKDSLNKYNKSDTSGSRSFQDCSDDSANLTQEQKEMGKALGAIQQLFECSGWCNGMPAQNLIYRFSDVNRGKPKSYCYSTLEDQVDRYAHVVGVGALITAAFLLFISIVNICICCQPARRKLALKDRFVFMKDGQYSKI